MSRFTRRTVQGFTLVEVMIVVAIIGILAAIAIPQFLRYSLRARQTEAYTIGHMAKNQQWAYWADYDCFAWTESMPGGVPSSVKRQWTSVAPAPGAFTPCGVQVSMEALGLVPAYKQVYYTYECTTRLAGLGLPDEFTCSVLGDVDGDTAQFEMLFCTDHANAGAGLSSPATGTLCTITFEYTRVSAGIY